MKHTIRIEGFREVPAIQEINASHVIELQDKSSELSKPEFFLDVGDEFLMQGSVDGINMDAEYSIHFESETGTSFLWERDFPIEIHPITLNFIPSHFYRYELRCSAGFLSFELECEAIDQEKLILRVSELSFPEKELFPEGKLRIITGLQYDGKLIERYDVDSYDYDDTDYDVFTVNECGALIPLTNTEKTTSDGSDLD
jgi:hypothetical protein